jgi:hypothetical protein
VRSARGSNRFKLYDGNSTRKRGFERQIRTLRSDSDSFSNQVEPAVPAAVLLPPVTQEYRHIKNRQSGCHAIGSVYPSYSVILNARGFSGLQSMTDPVILPTISVPCLYVELVPFRLLYLPSEFF